VSNRKHRFFKEHMQQSLEGVARKLKNFLFNGNRRTMRMLDASYDIRDLPNEDIWFVDPVHPIDPVYRRLASGVIKIAATLRDLEDRQENKRRRTDSLESSHQSARRPRETESSHRGGHRYQDSRPREAEHSHQGNRGYYYQQERPREAEYSLYGNEHEDDSHSRPGRGSLRGCGRPYRSCSRGGRSVPDGARYGGHRY
jgi:hypothetical protein